jgi:hypothetical protein
MGSTLMDRSSIGREQHWKAKITQFVSILILKIFSREKCSMILVTTIEVSTAAFQYD